MCFEFGCCHLTRQSPMRESAGKRRPRTIKVTSSRRRSFDWLDWNECTVRRRRLARRFWFGRRHGAVAVSSLSLCRGGGHTRALETNGGHRNFLPLCGRMRPGSSLNDRGPVRLRSDMTSIMVNRAGGRRSFRDAFVFRTKINLSYRTMLLRQRDSAQAHRCGESQRKNAVRHTLDLPKLFVNLP
jgi:hypothetical protein